jgi:hypothetical protein
MAGEFTVNVISKIEGSHYAIGIRVTEPPGPAVVAAGSTIQGGHDGRALSTLHNSADANHRGNQEPVILYDAYGDATQGWRIEALGNGEYKIVNSHDSRALCTLHNSTDPAHKGNQEPVILYDYYGDATQRWRITSVGGGKYKVTSVHDGRALSTLHNSGDPAYKGNQEPLIVYDYYGDATQKWALPGFEPR